MSLKNQQENRFILDQIELAVRIYGGGLSILYGVAKILKGQFIYSGKILEQPVNKLSGFELTWVYFGHSYTFVVIIGIMQILGALLFIYNRTKFFGAFVLLPVFVIIILIDIFYDVPTGALAKAVMAASCIVFVLLRYAKPLIQKLLASPVTNADFKTGLRYIIIIGVVFCTLVGLSFFDLGLGFLIATVRDHF